MPFITPQEKMVMSKRKVKRPAQRRKPVQADVPTRDYFERLNLDDPGDLEEALDNFINDVCSDCFLQWEAVVRQEQGLPLTPRQKKALSDLINFGEEDDHILYIDEMPRPSQPWYELARSLAAHLPKEPFRTYELHYAVICEGWPSLVECLETYGRGLSLPKGVKTLLGIFPAELKHRLWLQSCFNALSGLGQHAELTLANQEQQDRIEWFIELLQKHKGSVHYFDLTLDTLLTMVILPPKDKDIFVEMMTKALGLASPQDRLADYLERAK
jgi:hypothetical protein